MTDQTTITDRMPIMDSPSRKARHNARVRARLLHAAIHLLQTSGPRAVTIDAICKAAGMTRGGFYTHFPSKAAIIDAAARADPPFLKLLRDRSAGTPDALWLGLRYILDAFLRHQEVARNEPVLLVRDPDAPPDCDSASATDEIHRAILAEMARGAPMPPDHAVFSQTLTLALGAQHTARALPPGDARSRVIDGARRAIAQLFDAAEEATCPATPPAERAGAWFFSGRRRDDRFDRHAAEGTCRPVRGTPYAGAGG